VADGVTGGHARRSGALCADGTSRLTGLATPPLRPVPCQNSSVAAGQLLAARAVGATGRVVAVDVAAPLLDLARARAAGEGLAPIELRCLDATRTGLPSGAFDAVVCSFGVFFAADMPAFVAEMWRLVRAGGTLAITTWGPGVFEPASGLFWDAVRETEPSLFKAFHPWDEITTVPALVDLYARAGISYATAQAVAGSHRLDHPEEFWDVVLGSGYRATIDALNREQCDAVRDRLLRSLRSQAITTLQTDVIFGTATRPHDDPSKKLQECTVRT
jgi:SAM-dependent methyltransferase